MSALMDFIRKNLNYDKSLVPETVVIPRVIVQFVIDEEGNIIHPVVLRGVNPALDEEALRVVKLMPKWKPTAKRKTGESEVCHSGYFRACRQSFLILSGWFRQISLSEIIISFSKSRF